MAEKDEEEEEGMGRRLDRARPNPRAKGGQPDSGGGDARLSAGADLSANFCVCCAGIASVGNTG